MKSLFNILTIFFLLLTFVQTSNAQEQVRAALDSTTILIGDQIGFHLQINDADGVSNPSVDLSPLKSVPEIEIVKDLDWDTLDISGMRVLQKDLVLTSFDSGYYFIPALSINYKKNGQNISRPTRQLALKVNTFPADTQSGQIAPIKDIIREPLKLQDFLGLIIGLLALIAVVIAFMIYNRRKKAIEAPAPPPVVIPPHEIALTKLKKLKAAELWQQGKIKAYQSSLTYIVREYLENRFNIQALEQTSDQILKSMKANNIDAAYRTQLQEMFTMADLVKFAKAKPPEDANDKLMEYAENFVRKTKQVMVETSE